MEIAEFRALWQSVFPQRQMDDRVWTQTERMFQEMDTDMSGTVDIDELAEYVTRVPRSPGLLPPLDVSAIRMADAFARRPDTAREWIWASVGSDDIEWESREENTRLDAHIRWLISFIRLASQVVIVTSVVSMMMESLPEYQNADPDAPDGLAVPGTRVTHFIEISCIAWFSVEYAETWIHIVSLLPFYLELLLPLIGSSDENADDAG
eukprot:gene45412-14809_t